MTSSVGLVVSGPGILELLAQSGPMALFVLGLLGALSIVSWGIMIERFRRFRRADRETQALLERMRSDAGMTGVAEFSRHLVHSPLAALVGAFAAEISRLRNRQGPVPEGPALGSNPGHFDARAVSAVERRLEKTALSESRKFRRFLGFLATTASVAPFIGLFGTVWGIMNAFSAIGAAGGASIAAYAPGIAEALVATAAGLGAAIPAVAGYNYFLARLRHLDEEMEQFAADLLQRMEIAPR